MNRTGLLIALALAVLVGLVFGLYPDLDLTIAALPYIRETGKFMLGGPWSTWLRDQAMFVVTLFAAPAIIALVAKLAWPKGRMLMSARAALFLSMTLALAPGVLVNGILKDHWPRSRPMDVTQYSGKEHFTPWWDPRGRCTMNCSFVSGEASAGYWLLAPAALAPPQWRPIAYAGAIVFGTAVGGLRMAFGGHFASDVAFAGIFTFLVVWLMHGLIYRWPRTRLTDEGVERAIERLTAPLSRVIGGLFSRRRGETRPSSAGKRP